MKIYLRRIYEPPATDDGVRVLVDRLWPRGLSKEAAAVDRWLKELAPSDALRKWFDHDPAKWTEFISRYHKELSKQTEIVEELRLLAKKKKVTILYAAKDEQHNNAVALLQHLRNKPIAS